MTVTFENGAIMRLWFSYEGRITLVHVEMHGMTFTGRAECANGDQFQKAVGRRTALTRFLKHGAIRLGTIAGTTKWISEQQFPRNARKLVWKQYFKEHADLRKGSRPRV